MRVIFIKNEGIMKSKLESTESSVVDLLNHILDETEEDRDLALRNYRTVADSFNGLTSEEKASVFAVISVNDLSESMERFLKLSNSSIEKQLKVAKIVSDMLFFQKKFEDDTPLDEEELSDLQDTVALMMEKQKESLDRDIGPLYIVPNGDK